MSDTIEYLDFSSTLKEKKPYPSIVILDDAIESSVCDKLISQASDFQSAGVYRGNDDPKIHQEARNNQTSWGKENWVYELIAPHMTKAIEYAGWDFEISTAEPYQIAKSEVGEFHSWHQDGVGPIHTGENETRKLSLSLLLNDDYEGGDFSICDPHPEPDLSAVTTFKLKKGDMIIFPSHVWHKVDNITKGIRKSLLDQINGIGRTRKRALLNYFGSARAVESASFDDLKKVKGIETSVAKKIHDFFHN